MLSEALTLPAQDCALDAAQERPLSPLTRRLVLAGATAALVLTPACGAATSGSPQPQPRRYSHLMFRSQIDRAMISSNRM